MTKTKQKVLDKAKDGDFNKKADELKDWYTKANAILKKNKWRRSTGK